MKKILAFALVFAFVFLLCYNLFSQRDDTISFDKGETKIIAHRGLSGLEIENTDAAFIAAGERSYYGIEADVRRTSDGKFVICHDADLIRLAWKNVSIEDSTLDELLDISLRNGLVKDKSESIHLTTLEKYISICAKYNKKAILELKSLFSRDEIDEIVKVIENLGYLDNVVFISFDYANLTYIRTLLPEQPAQYLCEKIDEEIIKRLFRDRIDLAIKHSALSKDLLDRFHAEGLKVNCWTVDGRVKAEKLASWGVDYITTNILE